MHPNPAFRAGDRDALLDAAAATGFAHVFAVTAAGPMVVHAPLVRVGDTLVFHVARGNRAAAHLDGAAVVASVVMVDGYVTPNWYAVPGNQVPTWNYVAIEIDGIAEAIDEAALVDQLDRLAALHEPRVIPGRPWTRAKMDPAAFTAMLRGIRGFRIVVDAVRGTTKLSQNKSALDRARVAEAAGLSGNLALAEAMARVSPAA